MTFEELARKALRTIGAIGQGVELSANDLEVAWQACIDMFDGFAADRLTVYQQLIRTFPLVANQGSPDNPYTIGLGGDFDIVRPMFIPNANVVVETTSPAFEIPLAILENDEYARISIKTLASALPQALWYDYKFEQTGADTGLAHIYLYPVPNGQQTIQLRLFIPTPMRMWTSKTADYSFPPGYAEMLRYQLAKRCASEFQRPLSAETLQLVTDTFAVMERPNASMPKLRGDFGLPRVPGSLYNWRIGSNTTLGNGS